MKKKKSSKKIISKKRKISSFVYIGVVMSSIILLLMITLPDGSMVKGDSTSTISKPSALTSITSFFSQLFSKKSSTSTTQTGLSSAQLLAKADDTYADGNLPLGDNKYMTSGSKKGYIYLCNARFDENGGGAGTKGSWIHGNTWNIKEKLSVGGDVSWPDAKFSHTVSGTTRTISGNDLPRSHTSGIFPILPTDPAYTYDRNPNSISSQSISLGLPTNPTYANTPYCMGGEVGIMLTGVVLFNGFDAQHRDAAAYEVQDGCQGHPQVSGEYHYHSLSSCITDIGVGTVIGFALDGFPITGPKVAPNKYLTTDDLDDCHGITSEIMIDGAKKTMYHYVMTQDFPYSVSCFRGKPVSLMVAQKMSSQETDRSKVTPPFFTTPPEAMPTGMGKPQPPQEAITACEGLEKNSSCTVSLPMGRTISGTCQAPPGLSTLICIPSQNKRK